MRTPRESALATLRDLRRRPAFIADRSKKIEVDRAFERAATLISGERLEEKNRRRRAIVFHERKVSVPSRSVNSNNARFWIRDTQVSRSNFSSERSGRKYIAAGNEIITRASGV